jgi:hypothetical protein
MFRATGFMSGAVPALNERCEHTHQKTKSEDAKKVMLCVNNKDMPDIES